MKFKKLGTAVTAIVMSVAALGIGGCDNSHKHSWGEWQTVTPATCKSEGLEKRVCKSCDEEQTQPIPVDSNAHDLGDWQIVKPTTRKSGEAVKVCSYDPSHTVRETLPAIDDKNTGYSVVKNGVAKTFTRTHAAGDIVFDQYVVNNIDDAVDAAKDTNAKLTKGSLVTTNLSRDEESASGYITSEFKCDYAFGDNYVEFLGCDDNSDRFYTKNSDGTYLALRNNHYEDGGDKTELIKDNSEDVGNWFDGMYMRYPYFSDGLAMYGAGNFVAHLYYFAEEGINQDTVTNMSEVDGKTNYNFKFGRFDDDLGIFLHIFDVTFTLDENYVIDSADISIKTYTTREYDRDKNEYIDLGVFTYEEQGDVTIARLTAGQENNFHYSARYKFSQSSTEPKATPRYKYEDLLISSFDIKENGNLVSEGDKFTKNPDSPLFFDLDNFKPDTYNASYDSVRLYLRTAEGDKLLEPSYDTEDGNIKAYFNTREKRFTVNSFVAGTHTLVFKSQAGRVEKSIVLEVPFVAPTGFKAEVYKVNDETQVADWDDSTTEMSVYAGQSVRFRSTVAHPAYQNANYTVKVTDGSGADVTASVISKDAVDGADVSAFKSLSAGTYTVTLVSAASGSIKASFTVEVKEAPDMSELITGLYESVNGTTAASVEFTPSAEGSESGTLVITLRKGDKTTANYSYDAATRKILLTNVSGADKDNNLSLEFTETYVLYLSYSDEFGESDRIRLVNEALVDPSIDGEYALATSETNAQVIKVKQDGIYEISVPGGYFSDMAKSHCVMYSINDGDWLKIPAATNIILHKGDSLKVWKLFSNSEKFGITFVSELVEGEPELRLDTAEVSVGGTGAVIDLFYYYGEVKVRATDCTFVSSSPNLIVENCGGIVSKSKFTTATVTITAPDGTTFTCTVTYNG